MVAPRKPTLTKTTTHPTHRMDMAIKPSFNTLKKSMYRGPRTTTDTKPERRVLAETLDELKVLGLSGRTFEPEEFAAALASYLTLDIKISSFADPSYPLLRKHMESMGVIAAVFHSADHSTAWVLIPDGITGIPRRKVIYHELVHLAAGHPIWPKHLLHEERMSVLHEDQPYNPPNRLARREPPQDRISCENDADLRAEALLKASVYGHKAADRPEHWCAIKDHDFPLPASLSAITDKITRR